MSYGRINGGPNIGRGGGGPHSSHRNNNNNNHRNGYGGNGGGGGGYGNNGHVNGNAMNHLAMRPNPWSNDHSMLGGNTGNNFRPCGNGNGPNNAAFGGAGVGPLAANLNGAMSNDVLTLANSLVTNLLRSHNNNGNGGPPSLLDLPPVGINATGGGFPGTRGGYGGGGGNNGFDERMSRQAGNNNRHVGVNHQNHPHNSHSVSHGHQGHRRNNGPPGNGAAGLRNNKPDKLSSISKGGVRKRNPPALVAGKKVLARHGNALNCASQCASVVVHASSADSNQPAEDSPSCKSESRYSDVPNVMFYCHMCKKHMWDAASFDNHVKGRTHMMMKESVEESYRLRATMIRHENKVEEQLKSTEMERLKRMGKGTKQQMRREYCPMCDLHFIGKLLNHRKTDGHQQLKSFLHPRCAECSQEFSNRIDYDTHLLMPEHMKLAHASKSHLPDRRKHALFIRAAEDEQKELQQSMRKEVKLANAANAALVKWTVAEDASGEDANAVVGVAAPDKVAENGADDKSIDEADASDKPNETLLVEAEDVIVDFVEGDAIPADVENRIPMYNSQRQLATSMLQKIDCYECTLCGRFFDTLETATVHSRTMGHYHNFVSLLNERANDVKIAERRASAAREERKQQLNRTKSAAGGDEQVVQVQQAVAEEWDGEDALDSPVAEQPVVEPVKPAGNEQYDPSEATVDDDDDDDDDFNVNKGEAYDGLKPIEDDELMRDDGAGCNSMDMDSAD